MCKILAFTNTKKLNVKKSINAIGNTLLKLEKDGFGYALQGEKGIFGEKTVGKSFATRFFTKNIVTLPIVKRTHEMFGELSPLVGSGIFHGRTSTNVKGLLNCHPMVRPDDAGKWHLIHNGVVHDQGPDYEKLTQNDSEDVLHRLIDGIDQVEKYLEGYYAFAALDPQGHLHIGRDSIATLFIAWSEVYDSHIIATTECLLKSISKSLGAKIGPVDEIEDNVYMIFEGNELVYKQTINPIGYTSRQSKFASQSLGRDLSGSIQSWRDDKHWNKSENEWPNIQADVDESAYYQMKQELDNMDASYEVFNEFNTPIDIATFKKMDYISQELCTVIRGDGTVVSLGDYITGERKLA
jgi:predicted glutamine amidotransferase